MINFAEDQKKKVNVCFQMNKLLFFLSMGRLILCLLSMGGALFERSLGNPEKSILTQVRHLTWQHAPEYWRSMYYKLSSSVDCFVATTYLEMSLQIEISNLTCLLLWYFYKTIYMRKKDDKNYRTTLNVV